MKTQWNPVADPGEGPGRPGPPPFFFGNSAFSLNCGGIIFTEFNIHSHKAD